MKTDTTKRRAPIHDEEAPVATLTRLIAARPSTGVFGGWGPQMNRSADILRSRS